MIKLVVEGHGEVDAAPNLVRRILEELQVYSVRVHVEAMRCPKNQMTGNADDFKRYINIVRYDTQITGLIQSVYIVVI